MENKIEVEHKDVTRFKVTMFKNYGMHIVIPNSCIGSPEAENWYDDCVKVLELLKEHKFNHTLRSTRIVDKVQDLILVSTVRFGKKSHRIVFFKYDINDEILISIKEDVETQE